MAVSKKSAKKKVVSGHNDKTYIVVCYNTGRADVCYTERERDEAILQAWENGDDPDEVGVYEVAKRLRVVLAFKIVED